ncbi:MAG: hypothetical protein H0T92_24480, partial [Pyrinomonadaceae bacterium]|nr:hypothetical protein [Pyrinomonadaceae bacterium]
MITQPAVQAATLTVPAGGNLQTAIDSAQPGDTIVLEAGASYTGPITLPYKSGTNTDADWITIRTSAFDSRLPAAGQRVGPEHAGLMPKILSPGGNQPALMTAAYAHHYRFIGIEFMPHDAAAYLRELI